MEREPCGTPGCAARVAQQAVLGNICRARRASAEAAAIDEDFRAGSLVTCVLTRHQSQRKSA